MYFGHYGKDGAYLGFYLVEIHGEAIPSPSLELTDSEWQEAQTGSYGVVNGRHAKLEAKEKTVAEVRAMRLAELAALRYERETSGITVNGLKVRTDRESQAMLAGAVSFSDLNPEGAIDWKGEAGWLTLDKKTLKEIGRVVGAHVQACFAAERRHSAALEALATAEDVRDYDLSLFWPGPGEAKGGGDGGLNP
jgi:hypothetical protein